MMATNAQVIDIAPYRNDDDVQAAETQARTIADEARELVIVDEATNAVALDMLSQVTKARKRIEALKKRWLDPLNQQVKLIRADFDAMAAPAGEAEAILRTKTSVYRVKVSRGGAQGAGAPAPAGREAPGARGGEGRGQAVSRRRPSCPIVPTVAPPAKTVATDSGAKVTYRRTTHFEVLDESLVPDRVLHARRAQDRRRGARRHRHPRQAHPRCPHLDHRRAEWSDEHRGRVVAGHGRTHRR